MSDPDRDGRPASEADGPENAKPADATRPAVRREDESTLPGLPPMKLIAEDPEAPKEAPGEAAVPPDVKTEQGGEGEPPAPVPAPTPTAPPDGEADPAAGSPAVRAILGELDGQRAAAVAGAETPRPAAEDASTKATSEPPLKVAATVAIAGEEPKSPPAEAEKAASAPEGAVATASASGEDTSPSPPASEPAAAAVVASVTVAAAEGAASGEPAPSAPESAVEDRIEVRYYGKTDVGLIREHNEDNFLVADLTSGERGIAQTELRTATVGPRGAIFAVCDGMGGAAAGEVASQMAVDTIHQVLSNANVPRNRDLFAHRLVRAIEEAGNRIFASAKMDRTRRGMGTTATVAGLVDRVLFVGQVGDSRAYVLRNGQLGLITKDQSLVNQLIEAGQLTEEEAEAFEHSNIILQALGTTEEVTVDLTFLELRRGDRLMLCSDGLSGLVHPELIKDALESLPDQPACCARLIEMANAGGGHDNITVVCVDFGGDCLPEPKPDEGQAYQQYPLPPMDDPDRESLPPRDVSIKEGGRKPGADVKRDPERLGMGEAAVVHVDEAAPEVPVRPFGWGLIIAVLVLAVIATAVALAMGGRDRSGAAETGSVSREPWAAGEAAAADMVTVRVRTDINGQLFIDDGHANRTFGQLREGQDAAVELPPGAYRFEARAEDGSVVASSLAVVRRGRPIVVSLTLPAGRAQPTPTPDEPMVQEPGGATGGQPAVPEPGGAPGDPIPQNPFE